MTNKYLRYRFDNKIYNICSKVLWYMHLRHNKILKLVAILLFSFELLLPSIFGTVLDTDFALAQHGLSVSTSKPRTGFSTFLLFEEKGEEEREGKESFALGFLNFFSCSTYNASSQNTSIELSLVDIKRLFNTHLPLFKLHQVFLI